MTRGTRLRRVRAGPCAGPPLGRPVVALVVTAAAAVALSACTSRVAGTAGSLRVRHGRPRRASGERRPVPRRPPSGVPVSGAPGALAALVSTRVCAAATSRIRASPTAAAALKARRPATGRGVRPPPRSGSWMGTPVAVVTAGEDVTLAVGPTLEGRRRLVALPGRRHPQPRRRAALGARASGPTRARART